MLGVDDLAALIDGSPITPEIADWLREGLRSAIETGQPLERALDLPSIGGRSWRDALRHRRAREILRQAAELVLARDQWSAAMSLRGEIVSFRRYRWPKLSALNEPPETLNDLERCLFRLFRVKNGRVPESLTQIHALLDD